MDFGTLGTSETKTDTAETLRALNERQAGFLNVATKMIEEANAFKIGAQSVSWALKQIADLEQIHARNLIHLQSRLLDMYEYSADRRFDAARFKRLLTAGLSGGRDADRAAEGALAEMDRVRDTIEQMNARQLLAALATRARLLQQLGGPREGGVELAMELLRAVLPDEDYRRIVSLALEADGGPNT